MLVTPTRRRCRLHAHQLDLATIVAVHGPGLRLVQLRGRLKCQNCGARQADMHQVYDPARGYRTIPTRTGQRARRRPYSASRAGEGGKG